MLATDSRYAETAERDCADLELKVERLVEAALAGAAARAGCRVLAFEAQDLTVERFTALQAPEVYDGAQPPQLVPLGHLIESLRMIKDESELDLLARACAITSAAFEGVLDAIRPGQTERGFAVALERAMVDLGAEGLAFDTIVATGPNGAIRTSITRHVPPLSEAGRPDHGRLRGPLPGLSRGHDQDCRGG